jgi:hypothetical protein
VRRRPLRRAMRTAWTAWAEARPRRCAWATT